MMGIIINNQYTVFLRFKLEAPKYALKTFQPRFDLAERNIQFQSYGYGCEGIFDIMVTRSLKLYAAQLGSFMDNGKGAVKMIHFDIRGPDLRLGSKTIGNRSAINFGDNAAYVGIVEAEDDGTVKGDLVGKFDKGLLYVIQVVIDIQMFCLNIGDDCQRGPKA